MLTERVIRSRMSLKGIFLGCCFLFLPYLSDGLLPLYVSEAGFYSIPLHPYDPSTTYSPCPTIFLMHLSSSAHINKQLIIP